MKRKMSGRKGRRLQGGLTVEELERRRLLASFAVTSTADSGAGSLRQAILDAKATSERDTIYLQIPGGTLSAPQRIIVQSELPAVQDNIRPGTEFETSIVQIEPSPGLMGSFDGITLLNAPDSPVLLTLEGLSITGFRDGVSVRSDNNVVGSAAFPNRIFGNTRDGVRVPLPTTVPGFGIKNRIRFNSIYSNGGLGINLGNDGVTPNGPPPRDNAIPPNYYMPYPTLLSASMYNGKIYVAGTGSDYMVGGVAENATLDFYASPIADPSGYGEGEIYLGSATIQVAGALVPKVGERYSFTAALTPSAPVPTGYFITATFTAIDCTSEFSRSVVLKDAIAVVNNADSGAGSLRSAILAANARTGTDDVLFDLPAGQTTIALSSELPAITEAIILDGPTNPTGRPVLNGSSIARADGLRLNTSNSYIRGLDITGFRHGVVIWGSTNVIGHSSDPTIYNRIYRNSGDGVRVLAGHQNTIRFNGIQHNGGLAIDLGGDGITPNDPSDADDGVNKLVNSPVFTAVQYGDRVEITADLTDLPGLEIPPRFVDFYSISATDPGGEPIRTYLGSVDALNEPTAKTFYPGTRQLRLFAMVTDEQGNTSEYSGAVAPTYPKFNVQLEADSGPGTLRQAIIDSNNTPGRDTITFDLPGTQAHIIQVLSALPAITDAVTIAGSTQPHATYSSNYLVIDGTGTNADGLVIQAPGVTLDALTIRNFRTGLVVRSDNNVLGSAPTGTSYESHALTVYSNSQDGVRVESGRGNNFRYCLAAYNGGLNYNLGTDGFTPNDYLDLDTGPNDLLNSPVVLADLFVEGGSTKSKFKARVDAAANTTYTVDYRYAPVTMTTPNQIGMGQALTVTTDANGRGVVETSTSFSSWKSGEIQVWAILTDSAGNTSESSLPVPVEDRFSVTTTADAGPGSLRQAILNANEAGAIWGAQAIHFNLPSGAPWDIKPVSPLPAINVPVILDGSAQAGYSSTNFPRIVGSSAPADSDGLVLNSSGSKITGLGISGFRHGIVISGSDNVLGESAKPNLVSENRGDGVRILSGERNAFRYNGLRNNAGLPVDLGGDGPTPNDALDIDTGPNQLQNAPILTSARRYADGKLSVAGLLSSKPNTTYRIDVLQTIRDPGASPTALVSLGGFDVTTDASGMASFDKVAQASTNEAIATRSVSVVATDPAGNTGEASNAIVPAIESIVVTSTANSGAGTLREAITLANSRTGADLITFNIPGGAVQRITLASTLPMVTESLVLDATSQPGYSGSPIIELVSGAPMMFECLNLAGANSVVQGFAIGGFAAAIVVLSSGATITGNYIGLDASGQPRGNGNGIYVFSGAARIGGSVAGERNVISSNDIGVALYGSQNVLQGNYIGTDPAGVAARSNRVGVTVQSMLNTIGGVSAGTSNVISGNTQFGISNGTLPESSTSAAMTQILGNFIGTTADGETALPNGVGIQLPSSCTIGSAGAGRNIISGNSGAGIVLFNTSVVKANWIGLSASGKPLPNLGDGLTLKGNGNVVGGTVAGEGNRVAFNGGNGVSVIASTSNKNNAIQGNSIYSNSRLPIDLGNNGVTANDLKDADAGANNLQNFPVITQVGPNSVATRILGTFNSVPNASFVIDFYSSSPSHSESVHQGSVTVTTDANGDATFDVRIPGVLPAGHYVSATATSTGSDKSTSEMSAERIVPIAGDANGDGVVNFFDLTALAAAYGGASSDWAGGDFNDDGQVNFFDLTTLAANYGSSLGAAQAASAVLPTPFSAEPVTAEVSEASLWTDSVPLVSAPVLQEMAPVQATATAPGRSPIRESVVKVEPRAIPAIPVPGRILETRHDDRRQNHRGLFSLQLLKPLTGQRLTRFRKR